MTPSLPLEALETALRGLFPKDVAVAVAATGDAPDALWPSEKAAIAGAVNARFAEFAAGRSAARRALEELGHPPVAIPMGPDRAPIWPDGIAGSIAHSTGIAVAVARRGAPLGVDLEEDAAIPPDLWPILCQEDELQRLDTRDTGRLVRRVFSAKEAIFKAQDAKKRAMFGYEAVSITLVNGGFEARFRFDVGAFRTGQILLGRLAKVEGRIISGAAW